MDLKNKIAQVQYYKKENPSKALSLARKYNLKESIVDLSAKRCSYLAGKKAQIYGLFKKAIDLYKKSSQDNSDEINQIYKVASKEEASTLILMLKTNVSETTDKNELGQISHSKLINHGDYGLIEFKLPNRNQKINQIDFQAN